MDLDDPFCVPKEVLDGEPEAVEPEDEVRDEPEEMEFPARRDFEEEAEELRATLTDWANQAGVAPPDLTPQQRVQRRSAFRASQRKARLGQEPQAAVEPQVAAEPPQDAPQRAQEPAQGEQGGEAMELLTQLLDATEKASKASEATTEAVKKASGQIVKASGQIVKSLEAILDKLGLG